MKCAVRHCRNERKNKNEKISFFSFPKEKKLLKQWLKFCRQDKKFNAGTWRVCMEHFNADDIEGQLQFEMGLGANRYLKPGSIPSINGSETPKRADSGRLKRLQKRSNRKLVSSLLLEAETLKEMQNGEGETLNETQNEIEIKTEPEIEIYSFSLSSPNNEIDSFSTSHQEKLHLEGETLNETQNEIEIKTEPEFDQANNEIDPFSLISPNIEIDSFSTNHQEKLHLEALVKTLQKEVKSLKSENIKLNQKVLHMEKQHAYEISTLKENLQKKQFECNNIEQKLQEILIKGQTNKLKNRITRQK